MTPVSCTPDPAQPSFCTSGDTAFGTLGPLLFGLGYEVIPIPRGRKAPRFDGWQSIEITRAKVETWARDFPDDNVGIRTKATPAVDIDVKHEFSEEIRTLEAQILGGRTCRFGSAPKSLGVYRTDEPFRKIALTLLPPGVTMKPEDKNLRHKVEILGLGQQFVAYGRHPAGHDYNWASLEEPTNTAAADLPAITVEKVNEFLRAVESAALGRGWTVHGAGRAATTATMADDALLTFSARADDVDLDRARAALKLVANADEHDHWVRVGMACHHQGMGSEDWLEAWDEWSAQAGNYQPGECAKRWESFARNPSTQPTTFRYVLKYAQEGKAAAKRSRMDEIRTEIGATQSSDALYGKVANKLGRLLESEIEVDLVVDAILRRGKELATADGSSGAVPSRVVLRKTVRLAYLTTRVNSRCPDWLKPWVYVESTEQFFNLETNRPLSERAFNAVHDRLLLSDADRAAGKFVPEYHSSILALNQHEVKTVEGFRYMPGADVLFELDGLRYANSYTSRSVPDMTQSPHASQAVRSFLEHISRVFDRPEYGDVMLNWLSFIVQNPGRHPHWAILIQGVEGAGKTYFSEVMAAVLGIENVGNVSPSAIRGDFTGWAEGHQFVVVEEIRLHGENRFAVIDKIKPYITNSVVPIRRMRTDEYDIPNVTAYLLLTNHLDALPLARMDRRFCVLLTKLRTKKQIEKFQQDNPGYFDRLFDLLHTNKGAIRQYLLEREIPSDFRPYGHAPFTEAKQLMMDASHGDDGDELETLVETSTDPMVNSYVLNVSRLREIAAQQVVHIPDPARLGQALTQLGFTFVGRARDQDGLQCRFWSKYPDVVTQPSLQDWLKVYLDDGVFG